MLTWALFAGCVSVCSHAQDGLVQKDLFTQGEGGVHSYRIPALLQTVNGTLLAIADARYDSDHDLPGHLALVIRRSFDDGNTWTPQKVLLQPPQGGVGDASLLVDRRSGRVWCVFAYGPPGIGFSTAQPGKRTGPHTLQIHTIHSDDQGATWSKPVDLTPQIKEPGWQAVFATSGTSIQTSTGRLLAPIVVRDAHGVIHSADIFSDDGGVTWHHGAFLGVGTDESHTVQLPNGDILQNMRNGATRSIAISKDDGTTFGPVTHDPALLDPGCNAGITRYLHGGVDAILFTNAASSRRERLTVKASLDGSKTWTAQRVLYAGPSAYSTVIALHDGTIAVLYERGETGAAERITFARFPLRWLFGNGQQP